MLNPRDWLEVSFRIWTQCREGYYGYSRWGSRGDLGIVGTLALIAVIFNLVDALR